MRVGEIDLGVRVVKACDQGDIMVELTRMNGEKLTVNADLIEIIEEIPDTVITLTTGKKLFVKESRQKVKNLVVLYRKQLLNPSLEDGEASDT